MNAWKQVVFRNYGMVIWCRSDWKGIWIDLEAIVDEGRPGFKRRTVRLAWNGERFAGSAIVKELLENESGMEFLEIAARILTEGDLKP